MKCAVMSRCALLVTLPALALPALGAERDPSSQVVEEVAQSTDSSQNDWSIGAGLGWQSVVASNLVFYSAGSTVGYPTQAGSTPTAAISLERRFSPRLSVLVHGTGTAEQVALAATPFADGSSQRVGANLAAGPRLVLNPDAPIEVSLYGLTSFGWARSSASQEGEDQVSQHYGVGGRLGLAVERELVDNLSLRFESSLLEASYSWSGLSGSAADVDGDTVAPVASRLSANLNLSPGVQLRVSF